MKEERVRLSELGTRNSEGGAMKEEGRREGGRREGGRRGEDDAITIYNPHKNRERLSKISNDQVERHERHRSATTEDVPIPLGALIDVMYRVPRQTECIRCV